MEQIVVDPSTAYTLYMYLKKVSYAEVRKYQPGYGAKSAYFEGRGTSVPTY